MNTKLSISDTNFNIKVSTPSLFSQRLKSLRLAMGKTQAEMAGLLEINRNYVSILEKGSQNPSRRLEAMLNALESKAHSMILREAEDELAKVPSLRIRENSPEPRETGLHHETLSQRFKSVRLASGMTQLEYARRLGVSSGYVSAVERGERNPGKPLMGLIEQLENELTQSVDAGSSIVREEPTQSSHSELASTESRISEQSTLIAWLMRQVEDEKRENAKLTDALQQANATIYAMQKERAAESGGCQPKRHSA